MRLRGNQTKLERALRAQRPEAPDALVEETLARVNADRAPAAFDHRRPLAKLGVALAGTAALVGALVASGAMRNVSVVPHNSHPFLAANVVYAAPTVTCTLVRVDGSSGHFQVTGTTTQPSGTISVTVSSSPAETGFPFTFPVVTVTSTSWATASTTGNDKLSKTGHTYSVTATQTAAGFANGIGTC